MIKVWGMVVIGLIIAIVGIIIAKFSLTKGKDIVAIIGAFMLCIGGFTIYLGYDAFMMQPRNFKVLDVREINDCYRITLESEMKGMTNGIIFLSESEAKMLGFIDAEDNLVRLAEITESRRWVENHRE